MISNIIYNLQYISPPYKYIAIFKLNKASDHYFEGLGYFFLGLI